MIAVVREPAEDQYLAFPRNRHRAVSQSRPHATRGVARQAVLPDRRPSVSGLPQPGIVQLSLAQPVFRVSAEYEKVLTHAVEHGRVSGSGPVRTFGRSPVI